MRALSLVAGLLLLPVAACSVSTGGDADDGVPGVAAQGSGATRTYPVAEFTEVDLRGADNVDVRVGPGFSVRADGDSELLDHLKISRVGNALRVSRTSGWRWSGGRAKISITMPALAAVKVAGSGDVTVDRAQGQAFSGSVAGSGNLTVATLAVDRAEVSLAGSGDANLGGSARQLRVNIAGSGDVDAGRLTAAAADVSIAGSGNVRAQVDGPARVSVMGSGDVDLGGKARCQTTKMGSGSVRCGG